ncbi:AAA family ATPase [Candidatus Woesearchaeota archaeon]|nr:AAA family ATPase [Candidatus Woesearchaeota archaeon]
MKSNEKIKQMYNFISENLYLCMPDMRVQGDNFNSTLIFEMLSCLNNGKQLLFGEYGLGKTTSAELVSSLIDCIPKEVVISSEIRGHPEQTEEKMIGRPDLGELNKGNESVLWNYFVMSNTKIIDEFNRLPPSKQNILIDGIDRGNWQYLSQLIQTGEFPLFATCNYEDSGNGALIEPILDRFDIATESKRPNITQMSIIKDIPSKVKNMLNDKDIANKIFEIYNNKNLSYRSKLEAVQEFRGQYQSRIEKETGLELLTSKEMKSIPEEIEDVKFSIDAELYYSFIISELATCQVKGMKRMNEPCIEGCHYSDFACNKVQNNLSMRSCNALTKYSKALAWLQGNDEVTIDELNTVLPYVIWHKANLKDDFLANYVKSERTDPLRLYAAKQLSEDIRKRFTEQVPMIKNAICTIREKGIEKGRAYMEDKDHPIYREFGKESWNQ